MDRTVTVALQLVYDPRSARAFAQMAKEAAKASAAAQKETAKAVSGFQERDQRLSAIGGTASNLGAYGFAGRLGRMGSFAEGLQGAGFSRLATGAQRLAVPLAIAGGAANLAEAAALSVNDRYSTDQQKRRAFVRDILPGGERAQRMFDAFSGRAAGYEQLNIDAQNRAAEAQSRNDRTQFGLSFNPRQAGAEATARAYRLNSAVTPGVFDRTTADGERQYRDAQRLLPLKQAEAKAEREMRSAVAERLGSEKELVSIANRNAQLVKDRDRLANQASGPFAGSGVEQQSRLKQIESLNSEINSGLGLERSAREAVYSGKQNEARAIAERKKARDRTQLLGEAEMLESRVDTAGGAAMRLGTQNVADRMFGRQMARMIKDRGSVEGLPQEYIAAAQNFAPELIGNIIKKSYTATDEFKGDVAEFGIADFGTADYAGDSKRAQENRNKLAESEYAADRQAAESVAAAGKQFGAEVGDIINRALDNAKSEILNVVRLGRNQ